MAARRQTDRSHSGGTTRIASSRGRRLEDHLRFAVCYWHSFCWPGSDPFGGETFLRPWHHGPDPMALARAKADVAFELFRLLDVPFFTFHDADVAPEGRLARRVRRQSQRHRRPVRREDGVGQGAPAVGNGQPVHAPPLHGRCGDQSGSGGVRLRRRAGPGGARGDASARRPELRAVGRARGLRDPAQHRHRGASSTSSAALSRWWSSTSTRSVSRGRS